MGIFGRGARASGPGTVWGWGSNFGGILGERPGDFEEPTKIRRLSHVSSVHHDGRTAYAIKDDGSLWSWGTSDSGQLGDGKRLHRESRGLWGMTPQASAADSRYRTLPDRIMGLSDVSAVFGNNFLGRWVKSRDGRAFGWGGFTERSLTPVRLPALDGLLDLARTMNDVWALMPGGELIGCSANTLPRPVSGIHDVACISAAVHAFYAATRDGAVYASDDFHGEWKDEPDVVHSRVLGKVRDIDGIATIIAAEYDPAGVLAIGMDGSLWSWGIDPETANTGRERRYPPAASTHTEPCHRCLPKPRKRLCPGRGGRSVVLGRLRFHEPGRTTTENQQGQGTAQDRGYRRRLADARLGARRKRLVLVRLRCRQGQPHRTT